jgi:hypothetical protein
MPHTDSFEIPLVFWALESAKSGGGDRPSEGEFLDFFCGVGEVFDYPEAEARYFDLIRCDGTIFAFPKHELFITTFANPLKYAKVNYVLGNYGGTIALAGFVGEMCTVFLYDLSLWSKPEERQKRFKFTRQKFERKRQSERIELLQSYGIINEPFRRTLEELNDIRNIHIHGYRISLERTKQDAKRAYELAVRVYLAMTGQRIKGSVWDGWRKDAKVEVYPLHPLVREFLDTRWQVKRQSKRS